LAEDGDGCVVRLAPVSDLAALGAAWRDFESRAAGSFFQSWTWMGCLAEDRFTDPVLLEIRREGRLLAMALFNRKPRWLGGETLWLGESGDRRCDAVFIEHNGLLLARGIGKDGASEGGGEETILARALAAARRAPIGAARGWRRRDLVLSGVDAAHCAAVLRLGAALCQTRPAPFVVLTPGREFLAGLSANTRYQLRRSARRYAERGPLSIVRAASETQAHEFLDALAVLHQRGWAARGKPGAFANQFFARFHHALIARGFDRGEIDLLMVRAGGEAIGYLYNFLWREEVLAYQSGFDFAAARAHEKPGLTCHHLAIEMYAAAGMRRYDFLAGAARYKTSLASGECRLHWLTLPHGFSVPGVTTRLRWGRLSEYFTKLRRARATPRENP